jgi:hypothetical protein
MDCRPDVAAIRLLTYYLVRPADARFTFSQRVDEHDLDPGADCSDGETGVESDARTLSIACYVDDDDRANMRFAMSRSCPGVYVGVLGSGSGVGALARAFEREVGTPPWRDVGTDLDACSDGQVGVSDPPAPTNVAFEVHVPDPPSFPLPDYRLEVTWDSTVTADTTVEVYAVRTCPAEEIPGGQPCLGRNTPLPPSILRRVATAPAGAGTASWEWPGWEILGGAVATDGEDAYYGIVVRAVNERGASRFVIARNGNGWACSDCVY